MQSIPKLSFRNGFFALYLSYLSYTRHAREIIVFYSTIGKGNGYKDYLIERRSFFLLKYTLLKYII